MLSSGRDLEDFELVTLKSRPMQYLALVATADVAGGDPAGVG